MRTTDIKIRKGFDIEEATTAQKIDEIIKHNYKEEQVLKSIHKPISQIGYIIGAEELKGKCHTWY